MYANQLAFTYTGKCDLDRKPAVKTITTTVRLQEPTEVAVGVATKAAVLPYADTDVKTSTSFQEPAHAKMWVSSENFISLVLQKLSNSTGAPRDVSVGIYVGKQTTVVLKAALKSAPPGSGGGQIRWFKSGDDSDSDDEK